MKNHLLLMMGGSGTRIGTEIPKQYLEINGKPIFIYIIDMYERFDAVDDIVVVSHSEWLPFVEEWVKRGNYKKVISITSGGESRSHSVRNGLRALRDVAKEDDPVLIHDASHPYVDEEGTLAVIRAIRVYGGATLGEYQYDTVYSIVKNENGDFIEDTLPRQHVVAGASPEGFLFGKIFPVYDKATDKELQSMTSAGAIASANGISMQVIPCNVLNLKITHRVDLEALSETADYFFR